MFTYLLTHSLTYLLNSHIIFGARPSRVLDIIIVKYSLLESKQCRRWKWERSTKNTTEM